MKKFNNSYLSVAIFGLVLLFTACEDGDKVFDQIVADEQRGAVLRTLSINSNELPIGVSEGFFGVDLEVQDQENGALSQSIEVYGSFVDNTPDNGRGASTEDALIETLDVSSFSIGDNGLPITSYAVTLPSLLSATGVNEADIDGGDQFAVRFELVMIDGRRFSSGQNSGTLTGSYFSSPFRYAATIVCPPVPPTVGTWTVNMQDSYGDGWQSTTSDGGGPGLVVTLSDGTVYEIGLCTPYEAPGYACTAGVSEGTATFEVPAGQTAAAIFDFKGDFWGEMSFQIITPNGNVVGDFPTGTAAGEVPINYCVN